jgi:predicted nuclease of predicted toxin-antitoxin system
MTVAFYMDENIPRAVTNGLRLRGVDVLTVQEDNRGGAPDLVVLDRAAALDRLVFTQDEDFLVEAQHRQQEGINFAGIVYIHHQRLIVGECIRELEMIAQIGNLEEFADRVQYLPL